MSARGVTLAVRENEKAWSLRELNLVRPPGFQRHRYQIITVNRDDALCEWWDDLGPAERFKGQEFDVPSLWEHSVAELRDIAASKRDDTTWVTFMDEQRADSTLIADFLNQVEEHWRVIYNRSVFGPGGHTQRNGFPRKEVIANARST